MDQQALDEIFNKAFVKRAAEYGFSSEEAFKMAGFFDLGNQLQQKGQANTQAGVKSVQNAPSSGFMPKGIAGLTQTAKGVGNQMLGMGQSAAGGLFNTIFNNPTDVANRAANLRKQQGNDAMSNYAKGIGAPIIPKNTEGVAEVP